MGQERDTMGKAMLKPLKTKSEIMMETLGDKITTNFDSNKNILKQFDLPLTKSNINKMSGYMVRAKNKAKKKL